MVIFVLELLLRFNCLGTVSNKYDDDYFENFVQNELEFDFQIRSKNLRHVGEHFRGCVYGPPHSKKAWLEL